MKINGRGGHTEKSIGARDVLDELTEDRKIFARVKQLLIEVGNSFNDCTPPESMSYPAELNYGVNKCNSNRADVFFSTHLNSTKGAHGSEVLVYPGTKLTIDMGNRILSNLANLGFYNRGVKQRTDLMELYATNCPAMIIETCFVHEKDATTYRKVGVEKVARAIANGIDPRVSLNSSSESKPTPPPTPSKIDVLYKVWTAEDGWLPGVKNLTDYAGVFGHAIRGLMIRLSSGDVDYKVSTLRSNGYYPTVRNHEDYAGDLKNNIDKVQILNNKLKYRVRLLNGRWLPWVIGTSDFAGLEGYSIDAIEIDSI